MIQTPHADQDIYAAEHLSSRLEICISFSSIISNMYRYTVNIHYSILSFSTIYLHTKVGDPDVIDRYYLKHY